MSVCLLGKIMAVINDLRTTLYTKIDSLFSSKHELRNPKELERNPEIFLKDGFGISIEDGNNLVEELRGPYFVEERSVVIPLTKKSYRIDLNTDQHRTVVTELLDDRLSLIRLIKTDPDINNIVEYIEPALDTGIEYLELDKQNFVYIRITFVVRYSETTV